MITLSFSCETVHDPPPTQHRVIDDRLMIGDDADDIELCPYHGALDAMGRQGVYRGVKFSGQRVFFNKLIIPRDEPQYGLLGLIWSMHACDTNRVLTAYVNNLFEYFKLDSLQESRVVSTGTSAPIRILFSSRRKKPFAPNARIGRIIANEADLVQAIGKLPGVTVEAVEFFEMEFEAQLKMFRNTDILMGMHGGKSRWGDRYIFGLTHGSRSRKFGVHPDGCLPD